MPLFIYKATDLSGSVKKATLEAADEVGAVTKIQEMGLIPIRISVAGNKTASVGFRLNTPLQGLRNRIGGKDLMLFTKDLTTLIDAGLPIDRSLAILMGVVENKKLNTLIGELLKYIQGGSGLSDALAQFPKTFSEFYINMIRAGEAAVRLAMCSTVLAIISKAHRNSRSM